MNDQNPSLRENTIRDFGEQWEHYPDNTAYYGSLDLFQDFCGPLLKLNELKGARVADIGSGTGRIVLMLLEAGTAHVTAVEPSSAIEIIKMNTANVAARVTLIHGPGEEIASLKDLDFVFSLGVLHHIPEPLPVVSAAFKALKSGGRIVLCLYGKEGNFLYLAVVVPLRLITVRLPHAWLRSLCRGINIVASFYTSACRVLPLPMHRYMRQVFAKLSPEKREFVIYDQLNPAYAKYYKKEEVRQLLVAGGFKEIELYHRHGHNWTAVARKPL